MLRSKKNKKILLASYSGAHKMRWPKESLGSSSVFHHRGPQWRNAASEQHIGKRISSKERSSQEAQHDGNFLVFLGLCLLALHAFLWLLDVRLWLFVLVFPYKFPVRLNRWLIEGVLPGSSHTCRLKAVSKIEESSLSSAVPRPFIPRSTRPIAGHVIARDGWGVPRGYLHAQQLVTRRTSHSEIERWHK